MTGRSVARRRRDTLRGRAAAAPSGSLPACAAAPARGTPGPEPHPGWGYPHGPAPQSPCREGRSVRARGHAHALRRRDDPHAEHRAVRRRSARGAGGWARLHRPLGGLAGPARTDQGSRALGPRAHRRVPPVPAERRGPRLLPRRPFLATSCEDAPWLWSARAPVVADLLAEEGLVPRSSVPWSAPRLHTDGPVEGVDGLAGLRCRAYDASPEEFSRLTGVSPTRSRPHIGRSPRRRSSSLMGKIRLRSRMAGDLFAGSAP